MNKIKGFRKMLASLLAVSMVFTSVPGAVYASEMTAEDEPVSEVREIGASEQEPVILKNDTDSEISFISVSEKDSEEEKINALSQMRCTSFSASFNNISHYALIKPYSTFYFPTVVKILYGSDLQVIC